MKEDELLLKKLRWRCRRGAKELDVMLENYLNREFLTASKTDQALMVQLLDAQDPDLLRWFMGQDQPSDANLARLIEHIREQQSN